MRVLAALAALAGLAAPAPGAHVSATAVGVSEREWSLSLYRHVVRPGVVRFNVTNFGEDVHNLAVRGPRGSRPPASADIASGARVTLRFRLRRPGRWVVACTKPGHEKLGMRAVLRVVRRPKR